MPAFNAQRFLREAVESILAQTLKEFEFLILDDGSTDATWSILQKYTQQDRRIRLFQQENKGVAASLNFLISVAAGDALARMDADDISHPDRLRRQGVYFQQHPEVGIVSTARLSVAPNGLTYCYSCPPEKKDDLAKLLYNGINPITHGSVMMRKSVLMSMPEQPYRLNRELEFEDMDLWKRLLSRTAFAVLPTPLYFKRQYSGALTFRWSQYEYEQQRFDDHGVPGLKSDIKVAHVLKSKANENAGFNSYINAIALMTNKKYLKASLHFLQTLRHGDSRYRIKSLFFGLLALSGPLGLFIFRKVMNKPGRHFRY